jgi:acyl transferase domain-containing protein/acyl carrier protein
MADEAKLRQYLNKVTVDLRKVRRRLQEVEERAHEPVAIVGIGCRYPGGVASAEDLWRLVESGTDAISEFPHDRGWDVDRLYDPDPDRPGTSYVREGGFVHDAGEFDADFFGISPREALAMDPQQRLLLEVAWETFESAGLDPGSLRGSSTGVFTGVMYHDYGVGGGPGSVPEELEGYLSTGVSGSVVSGRVAYAFGLEGPAVTLDTACSSSLVAIHLAAQALRQGECSLALAGGVTVLSTPVAFVEFSRQRGLAPDGRCKSFAAAADGTGWAEGAGTVLLERLSDAERLGHRVLAVVRGSAVNQDGASNGLTAPNGPSQERVIRQALASARLSPGDVDAVEAHGTGTTLGDPIEAQALLETYGRERTDGPLRLGSVKSNLGHTQAAAGVAGVIKMAMAMRHGVLPRTLHVDAPSPHVDWSAGEVALLTEAEEWPRGHRPRRAAVSSFGVSGTNAHVILEEPPIATAEAGAAAEADAPDGVAGEASSEAVEPASPAVSPFAPDVGVAGWVVSGKSVEALRGQAGRLAGFVEGRGELSPVDVGFSLAGRSRFERRGAVVGADREQLVSGLRSLAAGEPAAGVVEGAAVGGPGPVFVFPGQGSQWVGMGVELLDASPVFAERIAGCEDALGAFVDWSLTDVLRGVSGAPGFDRVDVVQPALFAVMVSLAGLWRACGVEPAAVVGHSQGEIAAACVAGGLSLEDAARVVALRSRALGEIAGKGGMVSVSLPTVEVAERLERFDGRVSVAAINGTGSVTVSGDTSALDELLETCEADGVRARRVAVDYASHSVHVEAIRDRLLEDLAPIQPRTGNVPFCSAATGEMLDTEKLDATYWYSSLRDTVQFEQATRTLLDHGHRVFVETSPHPVVVPAIEATAETEGDGEVAVVGSLRRDDGGPGRLVLSLAEAHVHGVEVDWRALHPGGELVDLPGYAFQRRRYWLEPAAGAGDAVSMGMGSADHPLLGAAVALADGEGWLFTGRLSLATHRWLADHAVFGTVLLSGAAFVELALCAGREAGCGAVEELTLEAPLVLPDQGAVQVQVTVGDPGESGRRQIAIHSRAEDPDGDQDDRGGWQRNATGALVQADADADAATSAEVDGVGAAWPPEGSEPIDVEDLYDRLAEGGFGYGPAFQGLRAAWRRGEELYAEVAVPGDDDQRDRARYGVHPALLDAALHTAFLAVSESDAVSAALPFSWNDVRLGSGSADAWRVRLTRDGEGAIALAAFDAAGDLLFSVDSLVTRPVDAAQLRAAKGRSRSLYRLRWVEASPASKVESLALLDGGEQGAAAGLAAAGLDATCHADLAALGEAIDAGAPVPEVVLAPIGRPAPASGGRDGAEGGDLPDAARSVALAALDVAQGWLRDERLVDSTLVLVTERAVAVADGEEPDLATAAAVGLVRSAISENPGRFGLVDLDGSEAAWAALPAALAAGESQAAVRRGGVLVPRLERAAREEEGGEAGGLGGDGTVLITGGTGGLGALVARHLAIAAGTSHLLLASRRGPATDGAVELVAELAELGCEADVAACDVSDRDELAALLAAIPDERPLTAVIHAAGVLDDGVVESLDAARLDRVLAPKLDAALHLHELTEGVELSAFVLFSSVAGILGGLGQGNYAAANAFLDALAQSRRARGLPATSLAWGQWAEASGMTDSLEEADLARLARMGIAPLSDEEGLELLETALALDDALLVPVGLDFAALRTQARVGALPPLLTGLVRVPRRGGGEAGALSRRLAGVPPEEWDRVVLELVRGQVAAVLGHASGEAVDPERAFQDLGFDSLGAVELRNRLSVAADVRLPSTLVFDHPTPAAVASYLRSRVEGRRSPASAVARPRAAVDEPVAVVGVGCRYPGGVASAEDLWRLVESGTDAVSAFPEDRGWDLDRLFDPDPDNPGTSYVREGGFVHDAGEFDAGFFGISPREALAMDPQQRLLLEVAWETFESAGLDPGSLRGSSTGVFSGVMYNDYGIAGGSGSIPEELAGYMSTGVSGSVVSGRVAYSFGLEGPAVSVDTACSSSLVAIHLAAQALRQGECSLALAGGVTVLSTPISFLEFSRQRGLAPDGRCKAFSARADGAGFSEGVGLVLLERLSDAQRLGHRVLAVVRGSAVNQDGASNGLTAPNGPSQERVIRQALASARLSPGDVDVVEAHGTGTMLGDPIEAQALLETYGQERRNGPLRLGSIKSNIGHTQAAAGVAGVIKTVMAMRHGVLPPTLHVDQPTPHVDWSAGEVELLTEPEEWPANGRPRRAAVSSFGVSGTNAHVILEEPPAPETASPAAPSPLALDSGVTGWVVSGKSADALRDQAGRLAAFVADRDGLAAVDVGLSLAARSRFERRGAVVGSSRDELVAGLRSLAAGEPVTGVVEGSAVGGTAGPVFVFPGQGSQWVGMGVELLDASPVFAESVAACEEALGRFVDWSLTDVLRGVSGAPGFDRVDVVQPALFAVMVSLAGLWRACGVEPVAVVGHSQGEIAAACVAGGLSLEDAARVVALRSQALGEIAGRGGMVSISLPPVEIAERIAVFDGQVSVAAVNGAGSVTVSGDTDALEELLEACEADGVRARRVAVDYASHSVHVEAIRDRLLDELAPIQPRTGNVPFCSAATGGMLDTEKLDATYWYSSLRDTVQFEQATRTLLDQGHRTFVETSPHPVVVPAIEATAETEGDGEVAVVGSLRRDDGGAGRFALSLAEAHVHGVEVDWRALHPGGELVDLPTYAFQRRRYWLEPALGGGDARSVGQAPADHPLLGAAVALADGEGWLFTGRLSLQTHRWLADHAVLDTVLLPGAVMVELALRAGREVGCEAVEELTLEAPLVLPDHGAIQVQVAVGAPDGAGRRPLAIHSRREDTDDDPGDPGEWTRNAAGTLARTLDATLDDEWPATWPPEAAEPIDVDLVYDRLAEAGFGHGPAFQGLRAAWRRDGEVFAEVALADGQELEAVRHELHPALLDAALHAGLADASEDESVPLALPCSWRDIRAGAVPAPTWRVRLAPASDGALRLTARDELDDLVVAVGSVATRAVDPAELRSEAAGPLPLHGIGWDEAPARTPSREPARVVAIQGGDEPGPPAGVEPFADLAALREALDDGLAVPDAALVWIASPSGDDGTAAAARAILHDALELTRGWLADDRLVDSTLVLVTERAVAVAEGEAVDLPQASLWGLVRSAQSESPGRFALLDVDDRSWAALPSALATGEPQSALRDGAVLVPVLTRLADRAASDGAGPPPLDPDGTVLVSGGTGDLGGLVARHLVREHGVRRLLLASRRGPDAPAAAEIRAELAELGAEVSLAACDLAERDQVESLIGTLPDGHPLVGVVHAAGVLEGGTIESLTAEQLASALRPKLDAAVNLHELTARLDLSMFVLFSSATPALGGWAPAGYAAGNAFLDALAEHRHGLGLAATSIAWGPWERAEGLTAGLDAAALAPPGGSGLAPLPAAHGLALLDLARSSGRPAVVGARLDRARLRAHARAGALAPALRGLVHAPVGGDRGGSGSLARRLAGAPETEREAIVLEAVRAHAAAVLGHESADSIEDDRMLLELGLDSLGALQLRNRLATATGLSLRARLVVDHPTPAGLATHLRERLERRPGTTAGRDGGPSSPEDARGTLTALLREAHERAAIAEALPLLAEAARLRTIAESPSEPEGLPAAVSLSAGARRPRLICIPSFVAGSGPHQFVRLASALGGSWAVSALSLPGFRDGERPPASWSAAIDALAQAVRREAADEPFALAGYSIGGALAHALAERLEADGEPACGLVLIDTYAVRREELAGVFLGVLGQMLDRAHEYAAVDDDGLIAMAAYMRLLPEWEPGPIATPALLLRAAEGGDDRARRDGPGPAELAETVEPVTADHFSIIEDRVEETARATEAWLGRLDDALRATASSGDLRQGG